MESIRITAVDTTMPEDASRYTLHPDAYALRNFWDPLMRALACFFFLEVPFAIAYHPEKTIGMPASLILGCFFAPIMHAVQAWKRAVAKQPLFSAGDKYVYAIDYIGLIPMLDVAVTFFRAFRLPNGTLIYDLPAVRLHYTSERLLWDLVSFFPFDIIMALYAAHHHPYVSFVRLPRVLSLYTVWYKRGYNFSVGADTPMSVAIIRLLLITAIITHVFACVWWYIGSHHMLDVRYLSSL